jgi:FtsP/CotA-like multicopper oxidase with cupredoxin domain
MIPSEVDGSAEEGSPYVPPHSTSRVAFVPKPSGFRFYHSHVVPKDDLSRGTYTGQAGPLYIEPQDNPGAYDREIFLVMKEFEPTLSHGGDMAMDVLAGMPIKSLQQIGEKADTEAQKKAKGFEVSYDLFSINGWMLGQGEPIRVKQGERILFHVVNASATEIRSLALPGHAFRIVALDGNPVPTPAEAPVLWLGTAERVSALVEMNRPESTCRWQFGTRPQVAVVDLPLNASNDLICERLPAVVADGERQHAVLCSSTCGTGLAIGPVQSRPLTS